MVLMNLDNERKAKGKSMRWVSKNTGLSYAIIKKLCSNKARRIKFDTIEKLCNALECDIDALIKRRKTNK